jgi:hypothetical protein
MSGSASVYLLHFDALLYPVTIEGDEDHCDDDDTSQTQPRVLSSHSFIYLAAKEQENKFTQHNHQCCATAGIIFVGLQLRVKIVYAAPALTLC